jgi:hypothetical protein
MEEKNVGVENNEDSGSNYVEERHLSRRLLAGFMNMNKNSTDIITDNSPNCESALK